MPFKIGKKTKVTTQEAQEPKDARAKKSKKGFKFFGKKSIEDRTQSGGVEKGKMQGIEARAAGQKAQAAKPLGGFHVKVLEKEQKHVEKMKANAVKHPDKEKDAQLKQNKIEFNQKLDLAFESLVEQLRAVDEQFLVDSEGKEGKELKQAKKQVGDKAKEVVKGFKSAIKHLEAEYETNKSHYKHELKAAKIEAKQEVEVEKKAEKREQKADYKAKKAAKLEAREAARGEKAEAKAAKKAEKEKAAIEAKREAELDSSIDEFELVGREDSASVPKKSIFKRIGSSVKSAGSKAKKAVGSLVEVKMSDAIDDMAFKEFQKYADEASKGQKKKKSLGKKIGEAFTIAGGFAKASFKGQEAREKWLGELIISKINEGLAEKGAKIHFNEEKRGRQLMKVLKRQLMEAGPLQEAKRQAVKDFLKNAMDIEDAEADFIVRALGRVFFAVEVQSGVSKDATLKDKILFMTGTVGFRLFGKAKKDVSKK